ncbi:MAG: tRNA (N6-threonylcarbamoyladenosine(37)-N6)-methyltransferase TrmO [Chloroflexi bacterium]|nr:tRNA (N6-threonylcarbamoyladenosine(37)-N6)-methyltransferase TrmO [Chloroflexota bacterium]
MPVHPTHDPQADQPNSLSPSPIGISPIGVVRSPVSSRDRMPKGGVAADIEVFAEFEEGLKEIEGNTHITVIVWLHQAARDRLTVTRRMGGVHVPRGVFATRSPIRPNPFGVMTARLLGREGRILHLERLDIFDGTPVLDLKPYAPGFDGAFSARTARELSTARDPDHKRELQDMLYEAQSFHGENCAGLALGVRMLYHAMVTWGIAQKDPQLHITVGKRGCVSDALQALSGATFGNGRLAAGQGEEFVLQRGSSKLTFALKRTPKRQLEDILEGDIGGLFEITESGVGGRGVAS